MCRILLHSSPSGGVILQLLVLQVAPLQENALKRRLSEDLAITLNLFPPHLPIESICRDLRTFIDRAVEIANEKTEEKAIFHCFLAEYGHEIDGNMDYVGENDDEVTAGMSHFPGFQREIPNIVLLEVEGTGEMFLI
jgi:hypothetical protein